MSYFGELELSRAIGELSNKVDNIDNSGALLFKNIHSRLAELENSMIKMGEVLTASLEAHSNELTTHHNILKDLIK